MQTTEPQLATSNLKFNENFYSRFYYLLSFFTAISLTGWYLIDLTIEAQKDSMAVIGYFFLPIVFGYIFGILAISGLILFFIFKKLSISPIYILLITAVLVPLAFSQKIVEVWGLLAVALFIPLLIVGFLDLFHRFSTKTISPKQWVSISFCLIIVFVSIAFYTTKTKSFKQQRLLNLETKGAMSNNAIAPEDLFPEYSVFYDQDFKNIHLSEKNPKNNIVMDIRVSQDPFPNKTYMEPTQLNKKNIAKLGCASTNCYLVMERNYKKFYLEITASVTKTPSTTSQELIATKLKEVAEKIEIQTRYLENYQTYEWAI